MKLFTTLLSFVILLGACTSSCTDVGFKPYPALSQSVVKVLLYEDQVLVSTGSAVLIDCVSKGDLFELTLITAKHVVEDEVINKSLEIQFFSYDYLLVNVPVTQIIANPGASSDIALIKALTTNKRIPSKINYAMPTPISDILVAGYPMNDGLTVTYGLVSHSIPDDYPMWCETAPVYMGSSGGGVFDKQTGELIGIVLQIRCDLDMWGQPVAIPHMGIFLPMFYLKDWIGEVSK